MTHLVDRSAIDQKNGLETVEARLKRSPHGNFHPPSRFSDHSINGQTAFRSGG